MERRLLAGAEKQEDAGKVALVPGKVFGNKERLGQKLELGKRGKRLLEEAWVVRDRGIALGEVDLGGAALVLCGSGSEIFDLVLKARVHCVGEDAQGAFELSRIGNLVSDRTRLHAAELQDAGLHCPAFLEEVCSRTLEATGSREGICSLVCFRDMGRLAQERDVGLMRACQERSWLRGKRAFRKIGPEMEAEDPVRMDLPEDARLADNPGASRRLLCRLEDKEHRTGKLICTGDKMVRESQKHCHVSVMSAGVHLVRMRRGKGDAGRLCDRQGIHIGAEGCRVLASAVEEEADSGAAGVEDLSFLPTGYEGIPHAFELVLDIGKRLRQVEIGLWYLVQVAPPLAQVCCSRLFGHRQGPSVLWIGCYIHCDAAVWGRCGRRASILLQGREHSGPAPYNRMRIRLQVHIDSHIRHPGRRRVQTKHPFATKEQLEEIAKSYPTPFYIYDEKGIRDCAERVKDAFSWNPAYKEFFAIKATPNPVLISMLHEYGFGVDCSSKAELMLAEALGITGRDIMFSSNDTPEEEMAYAVKLGAGVNLDDISHIALLKKVANPLPEFVSLRFNPGGDFAFANGIFGSPEDAKFGMTEEQIFEAVRELSEAGVKEFGLHALLASNTVTNDYYPALARLLFTLAVKLKKAFGVKVTLVNLSGGVGIPYKPEEEPNDIALIGRRVEEAYNEILVPEGMGDVAVATELGRFMMGPYAGLVTRVLHMKHIYDDYVGVDACAANLMRPMLYGAYHHITVMGKEDVPATERYSVTGMLCENSDRFATHRALPPVKVGDLLFIHDVGAHGHSMGYNYNGRLRSAELLLKEDGSVELIRRAETPLDYFATLDVLPVFKRLEAIEHRLDNEE